MPLGVIRSEESPEETRGLTRSGDLSRMLPIEARLLATRNKDSVGRKLFMARRAERMLLSYERAGWVDDQPSRVTDRLELRPASEMGPIIVCLDTSASMLGARGTDAKSLTLECMRGAIRQQRKCIVFAFSGPENIMEMEHDMGSESNTKLLSSTKTTPRRTPSHTPVSLPITSGLLSLMYSHRFSCSIWRSKSDTDIFPR